MLLRQVPNSKDDYIRIRRAPIEARHFSYQLDFSDKVEN